MKNKKNNEGKRKLYNKMYSIQDSFKRISWYVVVNRILYYMPDEFPGWEPVNDRAYDEFEKGYLHLCAERKVKNELVHCRDPKFQHLGEGMMEINLKHPFVSEVFKTMKKLL